MTPLPSALRPLFPDSVVVGRATFPREVLFSAEGLKALTKSRAIALTAIVRETLQPCISSRSGPDAEIGYELPNNPDWAVDFNVREKRVLKQMGVLRRPTMLREKSLNDLFASTALRRAADAIHLLRKVEAICFRCQTVSLDERLISTPALSAIDLELLLGLLRFKDTGAISVSDVRFGQSILEFAPKSKTLLQAISFLAPLGNDQTLDPVDSALARQFVVPLAKDVLQTGRLTVAAEIRAIANAVASKKFRRNPEATADQFAQRYGVNGESQATLQTIGTKYGLTRERVRQITDKLISAIQDRMVYTPVLDALANKVPALLPRPVEELDAALSSELGDRLSIVGVARFMDEVLHRPFPMEVQDLSFRLKRVPNIAMQSADGIAWFPMVKRDVISMITTSGMALMDSIYGRLVDREKRFVPCESLVGCLRALPDFDWIDEERGWFWLGPAGDNRILSHVWKILAVAKRRLSIDEIFEGVSRNRRVWSRGEFIRQAESFPPPYVLRDLLVKCEGIGSIQYNFLWAEPSISAQKVLSQAELLVYEALASRSGIASRVELKRDLVESAKSIGAMNFTVILDQAPFIRQLERGVFALRGWDLVLERIAQAKTEVGRPFQRQRPEAVFFEGDVNGAKFELELRSSSLRNGAFVIPIAIRRTLPQGKYSLADGSTLTLGQNYLTGLGPVARARGWPAGSRVRISMDGDRKFASIEQLEAFSLGEQAK
jgi:hypothetical protein